jgi:hypothetical protein
MKKIILLSVIALFSFNADAQLVMNGSDTIVDTGAISVTQTLKNGYAAATFQAVVTKVSGTVGGTVVLEASNDGVNYSVISNDTLQLSNVSINTKLWNVPNAPYKYYRLRGNGTGTMAAIISGYCVAK